MKLLEWLDTHLIHHRFEWHPLFAYTLRPVLVWLICNPFEARILASAPDDFYEPDEPVADVIAAFERGEKHLTERPVGFGCQHMTMTTGNGALTNVQGPCGCDMQPIYATR